MEQTHVNIYSEFDLEQDLFRQSSERFLALGVPNYPRAHFMSYLPKYSEDTMKISHGVKGCE